MPNLQDHQLRVAAVAGLICDSLDIKTDKENIIKACLLHDMGNIIKFDLSYTENNFPQFLEPQGLKYWQDIQKEYFEKYGKDEHETSIQIAHEIESNSSVIDLINCIDGLFVEKIAKEDNLEQKICMYADNRVSPHAVVSIEFWSTQVRTAPLSPHNRLYPISSPYSPANAVTEAGRSAI